MGVVPDVLFATDVDDETGGELDAGDDAAAGQAFGCQTGVF